MVPTTVVVPFRHQDEPWTSAQLRGIKHKSVKTPHGIEVGTVSSARNVEGGVDVTVCLHLWAQGLLVEPLVQGMTA